MIRPSVKRFFSLSLRRDRWEREVEEEIMSHLALRAERLVACGYSAEAAKEEAIRRFGPLAESRARMIEAATHREETMRRREYLGELRQDAAFAMRTLGRNKGWAAVAILTLALGIGATTAVWSAASSVLLHPLPYPDADRVVDVNLLPTTGNSTGVNVAISPELKQVVLWREQAHSFEALEPYAVMGRTLGFAGDVEDGVVGYVTPQFAAFAGQRPLLGRNYSDAEVRERASVALLSEARWTSQYGGSSTALGKTVLVGGKPFRIIGVMPNALRSPRLGGKAPDLWLPFDFDAKNSGARVIARLRQGVPMETAARELDSLNARLDIYGSSQLPFRVVVTAPGTSVSFHDSLVMLPGAELLVLLVAAANVAHLLLARAVNRQREVSIRTALGASRGRLARQMMTETLLLCGLGAGLGTLLGVGMLKLLIKLRPPTLSELDLARVDFTALLAVVAIILVCALAFGAIAAIASSARGVAASLRSGAVSSFSKSGERVRSSLVVTEMALSAMLLVAAALLVRSVVELQRMDLGFNPKNLYAIVPDFPRDRYKDGALKVVAARELAAALSAVPGVVNVAVTDAIPTYRNFAVGTLLIDGEPAGDTKQTSFIDVAAVTPAFYRTLGARIVWGRMADSSATSSEIVINEGFARKHWKGVSPLGKRLRVAYQGEQNPWQTVVGVVRDISLMGPQADRTAPILYQPLTEAGTPGILLRTTDNPAVIAEVMSRAKKQLGDIRLHQIPAEKVIDSAFAPSRFIMLLMAGFTLLAVLLAAVGLYGMMAYAVAQRTREIGIRIALGATRERIARQVVGRGTMLGVIGAMFGLVLASWATRVIEGSLFHVSRLDATSFAVGGVLLIAIAVLATLVPMRRAVAVDPVIAIRAD
jgi:putative ABC transport system permease protein